MSDTKIAQQHKNKNMPIKQKENHLKRQQRRMKLHAFLQRPFIQNIITTAVAGYLRFIYWSAKKTIIQPNYSEAFVSGQKNMLGCFWHGRLCFAPATWPLGKKPVSMLISNHNDGKLISTIINKLHIQTIEGSTGKGGIKALKEAVETVTHKHSVCFTPDGPRGPRFTVSEGIIAAARLSGAPIIPAGLSYSRVKIVKSWDRFFFPFPLGRLAIVWGEPLYVPKEAKGPELEKYRIKLQARLNEATRMADEICGHSDHREDKSS